MSVPPSSGIGKPFTYTCARCGGTFESDWTEEDAHAEARDLWGNLPTDDQAVICDDCFNEFMPWAKEKGLA